MANNARIRGITIELNGDASGLNNELKKVDSELKQTQSSLRDVERLLKLDPGNSELLTQKQRLLNAAISETKQKLDTERKALEEISKQNTTGQLQEQQDALQREVIATEGKLKDLEKQLQSFGSVGTQQFKALGEKLKEVGSKITSIGTEMSAKVTAPIVAGFALATNAASDYEENLNKMTVAFGQNAERVREFADNAIDAFGMSKVEASSAASAFGALAKGIGLTEGTAADMSITLTGLSSDLSSYFNQSTDVSAKALEAIFTGEAEALKKFGVVMSQTNLEDFAAAHNKVYSSASEAEKVMIRYNYVLAKTSDAQGDYARSSDGFANTFRSFKAALEDLAVEIGQEVLPILTPMIKAISNIVKGFSNLPDGVKKVVVVLGMLAAAFGPILATVGMVISGIGGLVGALGMIGGGTAAATAGVAGLGVALTAVGTVLAGVAAFIVGGIIVRAVVENWDAIKKAFSDGATWIKNTLSNAWNGIIGGFTAAVDAIKRAWNGGVSAVVGAASSLGSSISQSLRGVGTFVAQSANNLKTNLANAFNSAKASAEAAFSRGYNSVSSYISGAMKTGVEAVNSFKSGAIERFNTVLASATNIYKGMTDGIEGFKKSAVERFRDLSANAQTAFDGIKHSAEGFRNTCLAYFGNIKTAATEYFGRGYDSVKSIVGDAFTAIQTSASSANTAITSGWNTLKASAKTIFAGYSDSIKTHISGTFEAVTTAGKSFADAVATQWNTVKSKAVDVFGAGYSENVYKVIKKTFEDNTQAAKDFVDSVTSAWDNLQSKCTSIFTKIKDAIKNAFTSGSSALSGDNQLVSSNLDTLNNTINSKMGTAKKTVSDTFTNIKNTLAQKLSWNIDGVTTKQPKITTTGKFDVDSSGNIIRVPTISMIWQKSAMQLGHILSGATIFGAMNGKLLGAGEAGKEVVVGANSLHTMVHNAAQAGNSQIVQQLALTNQLLSEYLPECAADSGGVSGAEIVGQIMPVINRNLGMMLS